MIIVVGADNTGKTTLVKHLVEKFGIKELEPYHTKPPKDYVDWYRWLVKSLVIPISGAHIADRFFIDELVYGPIKRGSIGLSEPKLTQVKDLIEDVRPLIILVDTDIANIARTFEDREQYPNLDDIESIRGKFYLVLTQYPFSRCPQISFDYEVDSNYEQVDKDVENYLKARGVL